MDSDFLEKQLKEAQDALNETKETLNAERQKGIVAMIQSLEETTNLKIDSMHKEVKSLIENMHNENTLMLKQIHEQTLKTNGRVTKLEDSVIPDLKEKIKDIEKTQLLLENRHMSCPIANGKLVKDFEETKENIKVFEWISTHPKIAAGIGFVTIMVLKFLPTEWLYKLLKIY